MKLIGLALVSSIVVLPAASPAVAQCTNPYYGARISDGETQHRNFCNTSYDFASFVACGGRVYTITTTNLGDQTDTILEVHSPEGSLLASDDDGNGGLASRIVWTAPVSGIYSVTIHQADNSYGVDREYDLHLVGPTTSCDLWTFFTGGSQWDEAVALAQLGDGKLLVAGRTESSPYGTPAPLLLTLNMDATQVVKRAGHWRGVPHAIAEDYTVIAGESNELTGGNTSDSFLLYYNQGSYQLMVFVGGNADDYSNSIASLGNGSFVVSGSTASSGAGGLDGWLYRIDNATSVAWQRTLGGSGSDEFFSALANANGDVTVSGYTTSFGAGQKDGLVARLDSSGNVLWSRVIGSAGSDEFRKVFETPDGGLLLLGTTTGSTLAVAANIWLVKLDGQGQVLWEKTIGGDGDDRVLGALAVSDGYVLVGYTDSSVIGNYDGLLMKVDSAGIPIWIHTYGGSGADRLYDIIQTVDGSLVAAGYTKSFTYGLADAWTVKTALDGTSGTACVPTTPPQMTVRPRASAIVDPALTAVAMIGTTLFSGSVPFDDPNFFSGLQCHLLPPTEVSGPTTLAPLRFTSRDDLIWEDRAVNSADSFNVYRGDIFRLPFGDIGSCLGTIPTNVYTDPDEPGFGEGWFYLVTGRNALGEGSKGTNSAGVPRANANPCP